MAVELHEEANGKIVTIKLSGKLTREDYGHFVPEVNRLVGQHGKIRMVVQMHDFHGWTMDAMWEDMKFGLKHFSHIDRLALVGDRKWQAGMAVFCKPFTRATVRYFDVSRSDEALKWIEEGIAQPA